MKLATVFTILLIIFQSSLFAQNSIPSIVPLQWLKNHLDDKHLVIVDVRDRDQYLKGHIRGAINIPHKELFEGKERLMPKLSKLLTIFSNAGIDKNSEVVSYDGGPFYLSARFHWLLKVLGHKDVGILAVSYGNWKKDFIPVTTKISKTKKSNFIPQINNALVATKLDVFTSLGHAVLIDARRHSAYMGKTSSAVRYGHIPTAFNYPATLTYSKTLLGNKMKSYSKLEDIFKHVDKNKKIILYCDASAKAAMDSLILENLGYKTAVYEGSWLEWGNDLNLPIVNPSKE